MSRYITKDKWICYSILLLIFAVSATKDPSECYSKVETEIKCPQYWQETSLGDVVGFDLTVENPGHNCDSFLLYIDDPEMPENWTASFYFEKRRVRGISIEPRQSVGLVLQVRIPEDTLPGDYRFTVVADGEYSIATQRLMVTVMAAEPVPYDVELYSPLDWQVTYPDSNLTFGLKVKNLAPESHDYLVYVGSPLPENWTVNFYVGNKKVKSFSTFSEESVTLAVEVNVPEEATPGDYQFRVQIDGECGSATKGFTVTVEGPPPTLRRIGLFCPFQSQTILTGQIAYYPIEIANEGRQTEKIFLVVNATSSMMTWDSSFSEYELAVAPQESVWITLDVKPPGIVEEGDYTMNITGLTEDGELEATLQITTVILGDYKLEISGVQPINPQVYSGEEIDTIVTVRNLGQSTLTKIGLNVNSTAISNLFVIPLDILALEPMASVDFYVRISPNTGLTPGDYIIKVQAESSETRSSERAFAVSVVSPIPWFWISICVTVIATALAAIFIQRAVSRWGLRIRVKTD